MFEKEAKEYAIDAPPPFSVAREAFHKGAEFGYNKAKVTGNPSVIPNLIWLVLQNN